MLNKDESDAEKHKQKQIRREAEHYKRITRRKKKKKNGATKRKKSVGKELFNTI